MALTGFRPHVQRLPFGAHEHTASAVAQIFSVGLLKIPWARLDNGSSATKCTLEFMARLVLSGQVSESERQQKQCHCVPSEARPLWACFLSS
jgi:hypothetical protein